MSFLAPLFLLGIAAITLPFWLHRLQTQSSDRKPFSSAMLLETTEQQVHVRKKLKYLLLLALRVALLLLLALVFAKPLWTDPDTLPTPTPEGTHLILIDTSASMSRSGVFAQAVGQARRAIDAAPGGAILQVLSADSTVRIESALTADRGTANASLSGLQPGAMRLDYGEAIAGVSRLADSLPRPVTLHFVSDFQDSGMPVRFADLVSPSVATLVPYAVGSGDPVNLTIETIRESAGGIDVSVSSFGEFERAAMIELSLNGALVGEQGIVSGDQTTIHFDVLPTEEGDNRLAVTLDSDDDLRVDNQRYYVLENVPPAPIPLITFNRDGLPVTYLSAALQSDPDNTWRVEPLVIGEFDSRTLARYPWLVIDDIGTISAELEAALGDYVNNGGNLLAFAGMRTATSARIPISGNSIRPASVGAHANRFLSIGQVDTGHPVLSATEGWYSVNVSQTVPIDAESDDQVLIRLENDEPFLLERKLGRGRVLLVAGGLENQWNDLPIRPVFVSFVIEAARYLSGTDRLSKAFTVGATLPLSLTGGTSGQVIDPDGNNVLSLADTTRAQQIKLSKPGFYEVYTAQGSYIVAVNADTRESQLQPVADETLQRWVAAMGGQADGAAASSFDIEAEPVELWPVLLFILALVLIAESLLSNFYLTPRTTN
jgi:hypothetical protein